MYVLYAKKGLQYLPYANNQMNEISESSGLAAKNEKEGGAELEIDDVDQKDDDNDNEMLDDLNQINIDLQKTKNNIPKKQSDSNPADDHREDRSPSANARKLHVPPKRDRPQSNVNFVTSKLSNLFQAANLLEENDSDLQEPENQ